MSKPETTYGLAMAAGHDAGNRSMREGGRTVWAVKDWNVACETFERLWPTPSRETTATTSLSKGAVINETSMETYRQ